LLIRLEAKTVLPSGKSIGLNLTRSSLDAATKYPWTRSVNARKFGVYEDDLEIFNWYRSGVESGKTSMEAQIMDWSDDIAYSVHDLEDSLVSDQIKLDQLSDDLPKLFKVAKESYLADITESEMSAALSQLQQLSCWPKFYDGSHRSLARLKDLASQLIGRFAQAAEIATQEKYGDGDLIRYNANLIVPRAQRVEVAVLKSMAGHYVINAAASQERYAKQQQLLSELVEAILTSAPATLETFFLQDWEMAENDQQRLRVVIDQVASLTDPGAQMFHAKLTSKK
ncbi:MAG: deoxyguanosinetriphosphate triphosphohydrolase, partial [Actinobacteria bacterium]|nr:deoxyguanosinetriphosphate triphosphohydrolase [Actinomycetota bacterium]